MDLEGGWAGLGSALAREIQEECRNRPRVCYAFLRRGDAPTGPGCRLPGAMGGDVATGGQERGAGGARSAVNLALGLHGLCEAFSLSFVLDEEACNAEVSTVVVPCVCHRFFYLVFVFLLSFVFVLVRRHCCRFFWVCFDCFLDHVCCYFYW